MQEFRRLLPEDSEQMARFLALYPEETLEMTGRFEKYGIANTKLHKREGDWFGAYRDGELTGIFTFSNHRSFLCHYIDDEVLKRVVLLKTLRQYAPKNLSGTAQCIEPIFNMLSKALKDFRYSECWQMIANGAPPKQALPQDAYHFVEARQFDLNKAMEFLIEAEKAFGRKPRMNSDLKTRVVGRDEHETYLFLTRNGAVISQGLIDYQTREYGQISAVYTALSHRGKGYGSMVMQELMSRIHHSGKKPALIVEKKNHTALRLYEKLGFEKGPASVVINIEMD